MTAAAFEILSGSGAGARETLDVLNEAYGEERFDDRWLRWKHIEGPWGPSKPILARDGAAALGAVFVLPWPFRIGGRRVHGVRFVDGGTTPAARRRGVFAHMIRSELDSWQRGAIDGFLLATATPAAQASHVKNGAHALPGIRYRYQLPPLARRARLERGESVIETYTSPVDDTIRTDWDPASLRWRTDERSGHRYEAVSLAAADEPNGLVYRVVSGKFRCLAPLVSWGSAASRARLLSSVALVERCPVTMSPGGAGSEPNPGLKLVERSAALVCVWDRRRGGPLAAGPQVDRLESWRLGAADVEGLI